MNERLATFCLGLWGLGLLEMSAARGFFGHTPGAPWFDLGAALWVVGGVSYCFLGLLHLWPEKERA